MFLLFVLSGSAPVVDFLLFPDSKSRPQRSISDSPLKYQPLLHNTGNAQFSLEAPAILENLNFSMQGKILFTYLLLCKQQVDGAWLLNNVISPQRCVCLCDGLAGVRGHPCLLLQRKRCFLMPVDYTENAVSYSNRVLELYHFNEWAHCSSGCEMMLFKITHLHWFCNIKIVFSWLFACNLFYKFVKYSKYCRVALTEVFCDISDNKFDKTGYFTSIMRTV